jgi:ribosomal protein L32
MAIIGIIIVICIVWPIVADIVVKHRQKVRDQIAHELLDNIDLQKEKENVKNISIALDFVVDPNKCPNCGSSLINHRQISYQTRKQKIYAGYLRCSNYPQCHFAKQIYPINLWDEFVNGIK